MKKILVLILFFLPTTCWGQTNSFAADFPENAVAPAIPPIKFSGWTPEKTETAAITLDRSAFHKAINEAANEARKAGEITRVEQIRIRIAMMSPAFRKYAEQLAVIQMAFSGSEVPTDTNGNIDETAIDWGTVIPYLVKFLELLLELLQDFEGVGG